MKTLQVYHEIKDKVTFLYHKLKLFKYENTTGRTLALPLVETITLSLYKQTQSIPTKKAIWKDFGLSCSYKTLTVSMNRCSLLREAHGGVSVFGVSRESGCGGVS
jgi:hypothetical protein